MLPPVRWRSLARGASPSPRATQAPRAPPSRPARYPAGNDSAAFEAITASDDILCETRPTYVVRAQYVAQFPECFGKDAQGPCKTHD